MRDHFEAIELFAYLLSVGLWLPLVSLLKPHWELAAGLVLLVAVLPFPLYVLRLRMELYSWLESVVLIHLKLSWGVGLLVFAAAIVVRFR